MITFLTWFGLACFTAVILALTFVIVVYLLYAAERKFNAILRTFRLIWRFYKSLPRGKFARSSRYFIAVWDRERSEFTYTEAVDDEYRNEAEYEAWVAEMKERLSKRKGDATDGE